MTVVGSDQDLRALIYSVAYHALGRNLQRRRDGVGIAQRLRCHPVLAVGAMQVATQHAEAVGERARMSVKERLLLDGVALHAGGISPGDKERPAAIETHFA